MARFICPHLRGSVELSPEREHHIAERHPDLLPDHRDEIPRTLAEPDQVRLSGRFGRARLFCRWCSHIRQGKHVVVSERDPQERHWVITAYMARRLAPGDVEWQRD